MQKWLINESSGAVGTTAIQIAKYYGVNVTGVCSTSNIDMVKSLGADAVVDYTKEDFTKNGKTYDVIFDTVGRASLSDCVRSLNKKGILILGASGLSGMLQGLWTSMTSSKKVITGIISEKVEDINFIKGIIENGKMKAVIDRSYSLVQMAEAHEYVEKGHKKGNVVIMIQD